MKVSIIVPVYNVENVLHYCVDSILAQTYKDFELILVDDGSTDGSASVCDEFDKMDNRIRVIHKENGGVSTDRNAGIELVAGECICFIDSDDFVAKDYLEELLKSHNQFPDNENIWCGFQTVTDYNGSDSNANLASNSEEYSIYTRSEIMTLHEKWLSQMPWNKLFKTSIIKDNNIRFSKDLSLGEDLLFNLNYIDYTNGKILIINKPLNYYLRTEKESLDNKYYPNLYEIYKIINSQSYYYINKWDCDKTQIIMYYNSCFYSYEKTLRNTFRSKSDIKKKYKYNKQIMKSKEFKTALKNCNCYIHPLYRFGYQIASYRLIRLLDKLIKKMKR